MVDSQTDPAPKEYTLSLGYVKSVYLRLRFSHSDVEEAQSNAVDVRKGLLIDFLRRH